MAIFRVRADIAMSDVDSIHHKDIKRLRNRILRNLEDYVVDTPPLLHVFIDMPVLM